MRYIIDEDVLLYLLEKETILTILENNGVDNWIGYNYNSQEIESIAKEEIKSFKQENSLKKKLNLLIEKFLKMMNLKKNKLIF